ncbi:MAG: glycosyltransferase family 9 protein [Phycisphaeraceae bacterium]
MSRPASQLDPAAARRVLIVRPSALGDVSRTVPVLASLRRALPAAHIDWLVADACADAVRHHPMLDGVVRFNRGELSGFGLRPRATRAGLGLAKTLRRAAYDVVYDLQGLARSGLFTWLTRAPRRVGFAGARELGWLGYNVRHRAQQPRHTVDQMLALVAADGVEPVVDMRLYVGGEDRQWLAEYTRQQGLEEYVCLAPTARWGCKCWPIGRYARLAQQLLETGVAGRQIVLLASPAEREQVEPLFEALPGELRARVHLPRTTVGQMMALISRARLLVCNDSAPLHIGVGFDRPIVAIFGPTDPAFVGPYQRLDSVVRPTVSPEHTASYRRHLDDQTLISQVSFEQVWEKIEQQLAIRAAG